jgi:hypothetical protein
MMPQGEGVIDFGRIPHQIRRGVEGPRGPLQQAGIDRVLQCARVGQPSDGAVGAGHRPLRIRRVSVKRGHGRVPQVRRRIAGQG